MPKYELFYRSGGHGGPYNSFGVAVSQARSRIHHETYIDIVDRETGEAHTLRKGEEDTFTITKSKRRYRAPCP
jgi:hypothetical protein